MKRALIASILGIAASVATSYGQGHVAFSTYWSSSSMIHVAYGANGNGHSVGEIVGSGFTATLYYGLGSSVPFSGMTALSSSATPVGSQAQGIISGGAIDILNYVSGPITFGIVVDGTVGGVQYNNNNPSAQPLTWTEPSIATGLSAAGPFTYSIISAGLPQSGGFGFIGVTPVPEPTTMALAGLGAAALVIFRRRK